MTARRIALAVVVFALAACAGILGFKKKQVTDVFPHRAHVTAGVSCTRCHANIDDGAPSLHLPDDATCTTCHTKPHDTRSCTSCHVSPTAVAATIEARSHLKFDHKRHLKQTTGNCVRCHSGVAEGDERMRPKMAACFKCHDGEAERDGRRCDACHKDLAEEGSLPESHLAHDGDWLREHGARASSSGELCDSCHKASFCASCHGKTVPALPATQRFSDPLRASVHRAGFASRHSLEARSDPGACTTCHQPDRCASCHVQKGVAGERVGSPHPAGWVGATNNLHGREARRDPASCAGCHGGAGEQLCVSCHAVGGIGGNPHPPGWSSRQPMGSLPCRLCHPVGSR
ncbi:MAG TPA: cytochrome c3 family protein [Kofleriaceae bacterium]|nr:cytochrome c3 family protein [Kofleriaceae bacterium]